MDKVLWNSFLLYKNVAGKSVTFLEFQIKVVEELLCKSDDATSGQKNSRRPPIKDNSTPLTKQHFLSTIFLLLLKNGAYKTVQNLLLKKGCK